MNIEQLVRSIALYTFAFGYLFGAVMQYYNVASWIGLGMFAIVFALYLDYKNKNRR